MTSTPQTLRSEQGFTLIEGLIATALLFAIALGILPLFVQSTFNARRGWDSTSATTLSQWKLDELTQLPFNDPFISVPTSGPADFQRIVDYFDEGTKRWTTTLPEASRLWVRVSDTQQFNFRDVMDNGILDNPLPAGADPRSIHLKLIGVTLNNAKREWASTEKRAAVRFENLTVRTLKAF